MSHLSNLFICWREFKNSIFTFLVKDNDRRSAFSKKKISFQEQSLECIFDNNITRKLIWFHNLINYANSFLTEQKKTSLYVSMISESFKNLTHNSVQTCILIMAFVFVLFDLNAVKVIISLKFIWFLCVSQFVVSNYESFNKNITIWLFFFSSKKKKLEAQW